jgi:hypothetical protein
MTRYEQLQKRFLDQDAAQTAQLNLLAKSAQAIVSGFGKFLDIPSEIWFKPDGKAGDRYIMLGTGNGESFKEQRWTSLSSKAGVVEFTIAITVRGEEEIPRCTVTYPMTAKFCEAGYEFTVQSASSPIVVDAQHVKDGKLEAVYEVLLERLNDFFDPGKVLIKS